MCNFLVVIVICILVQIAWWWYECLCLIFLLYHCICCTDITYFNTVHEYNNLHTNQVQYVVGGLISDSTHCFMYMVWKFTIHIINTLLLYIYTYFEKFVLFWIIFIFCYNILLKINKYYYHSHAQKYIYFYEIFYILFYEI